VGVRKSVPGTNLSFSDSDVSPTKLTENLAITEAHSKELERQVLSLNLKVAELNSVIRSMANGARKKDEGHQNIINELFAHGASIDQVDVSHDIKKVGKGLVIHERPNKVLALLFSDTKVGVFRRYRIYEYTSREGSRIIFLWQIFLKKGVVEFLLQMNVPKVAHKATIEISSTDESNLPTDQAKAKLKEHASDASNITRARLQEGKMRAEEHAFGQTVLTLMAEVEASKFSEQHQVTAITQSLSVILGELESHFHKPGVIDERWRTHFVENLLNAPPLTQEENLVVDQLSFLEENLRKKGQRARRTVKTGIDKFLWRDEDKDWYAYEVTVDISAQKLLADLFNFGSYTKKQKHKQKYQGLPFSVRTNVGGKRSTFVRYAMHFPPPYKNRVFDNWCIWKEIERESDGKSYIIGVVPLEEYHGEVFRPLSEEKFKTASTTYTSIIKSLAPNVSRLTKIQTVDTKVNLPNQMKLKLGMEELRDANLIQERYLRNGKKVDKEIRDIIAKEMIAELELSNDQKQLFKDNEEFFGEDSEAGWETLNYKGVKMGVKHLQQKRGSNSIVIGKAKAETDCTAEVAAAWFFDYCSRQRLALEREKGSSVRLEIRKELKKVNERRYSTIKVMPFPLRSREFVQKFVWRKIENGIQIAWAPTKDIIDYGGGMGRVVRGINRGIFTAINEKSAGKVPQCRLKILSYLDGGGFLPTYIVQTQVPKTLAVIKTLSDTFKLDEKIDTDALALQIEMIRNKKQHYKPSEIEAIEAAREIHTTCKESTTMTKLESTDPFVEMKLVYVEGEGRGIATATAIIDAEPEVLAASEYHSLTSRQWRNDFKVNGVIELETEKINDHSLYYYTVRDFGILGFFQRENKSIIRWAKEQDGTIILSYMPLEKKDGFVPKANARNKGFVKTKIQTSQVFEQLHDIENVPQTEVTFTTIVDLGGIIHSNLVDKLATKFLSSVSILRKKYSKSASIDATQRQKIKKKIMNIRKLSSETFQERLEDEEDKVKSEGAFPLSETFIKVKRKGMGWGKTSLRVRAELEEAAAFFWDFNSRIHKETTGDQERLVEKSRNEWELVLKRRQKIESKHGSKHRMREFWNTVKLHKVDNDTIVITMEPIKSHRVKGFVSRMGSFLASGADRNKGFAASSIWSHGSSNRSSASTTEGIANTSRRSRSTMLLSQLLGRKIFSTKTGQDKEAPQEASVRQTDQSQTKVNATTNSMLENNKKAKKKSAQAAAEEVTIRFQRTGNSMATKVEFVTRLNLGKSVSEKATRFALERHLDEAAEAERYFTNLVTLESMTSELGEALGADMVWDGGQLGGQHSRKDREKHIEKVCEGSAALREVVKKYPWFVTMLKRARLGEIAVNRSRSIKLECVEEKDARVIGNNFMPCLKSRKVARAGVDIWRLQNKAVGELIEEFPWMKEMFVALGEGVVKAAPWGLMFRVITGAATSSLDLWTDVWIAATYYSEGKHNFFLATTVMLGASIGLQLFVILILQNSQMNLGRKLYEAVFVIFGMKPALDAYRVSSGKKKAAGSAVGTLEELSIMKGIEMFAESIPGVIIQLTAIFASKHISAASYVSLAFSALSTGFIGATISYDYDTDPERRELKGRFYGFVPSKPIPRTVSFLTMIVLIAGFLMIRCTSIVLFGLVSLKLAWAFILTDMALYLIFKVLRGDFYYWLPLGGKSEIVISIFTRIIIKAINDFTSIAQFRHPYEVGGFYWLFSMIITVASLPISITVFENSHGNSEWGQGAVTEAKRAAWYIIPATVIALLIFFLTIERKYIKTFFSFTRGKDLTVRGFREGKTDLGKAVYSFNISRKHWSSIEEEVKGWVEASWTTWEEEKPKWLDAEMRMRIPVEFIPTIKAKKRERRRRATIMTNNQNGDMTELIFGRGSRRTKLIPDLFMSELQEEILKEMSTIESEESRGEM